MTDRSNGSGCTNAGRIDRFSASSIEKKPRAHLSKKGARASARGHVVLWVLSNPFRLCAWRHARRTLGLRSVGDHPLGGDQQSGDRGGILERYPHDLGRIDNPGRYHVLVVARLRVVSVVRLVLVFETRRRVSFLRAVAAAASRFAVSLSAASFANRSVRKRAVFSASASRRASSAGGVCVSVFFFDLNCPSARRLASSRAAWECIVAASSTSGRSHQTTPASRHTVADWLLSR